MLQNNYTSVRRERIKILPAKTLDKLPKQFIVLH